MHESDSFEVFGNQVNGCKKKGSVSGDVAGSGVRRVTSAAVLRFEACAKTATGEIVVLLGPVLFSELRKMGGGVAGVMVIALKKKVGGAFC